MPKPIQRGRFRVIEGGVRTVMLANGTVVDVRDDPFVLPPGQYTSPTELQVLESASQVFMKHCVKGQFTEAETALRHMTDAVRRLRKRRKR